MSSRKGLMLALSANVGLTLAVVLLALNRSSGPAEPPAAEADPKPSGPLVVTNTLMMVLFTNSAPVDWHAVQSDNYKRYILNLRTIGCPDETVRDVVLSDTGKFFTSQLQALASQREEFKFWKNQQFKVGGIDSTTLKQQLEIGQTRKALLKDLLGIDVEDTAIKADALALGGDFLNTLSKDKAQRVSDIESTYAEKAAQLTGGSSLFSTSEKTDLTALIIKLQGEEQLAKYLWNRLPPTSQAVLKDPASTPEQKVAELNRLLSSGSIYEPKAFATVTNTLATRILIARDDQSPLSGSELVHLNRLLLEQAYPAEIEKSPEVDLSTGRSSREVEMYRQLQTEKSTELAKVLSPQELEEYELRFSALAQSIRTTLGDFEASEQEFREVFRARKDIERRLPAASKSDEDIPTRDRHTAMEMEMARRLRAAFGEARYVEYEHESQSFQDNLRELAARHRIPKDTLYKLVDIKRDALKDALQIRSNLELATQVQHQQLARLRQSIEQTLTNLLSETALKDYLTQSAHWLDQVVKPS